MNTENTKKIRNILLLSILLMTPLFAQQEDSKNTLNGIQFGGGVAASYMTFFTYENVSYKLSLPEENIAFDFGVLFFENYLFDPYFYYCPFVQIDIGKHYYFGAGFLNSISGVEDNLHTFLVKTGALVGNWEMGKGTGNIDIGIEISPTRYFDPYCKYPGSEILQSWKSYFVNLFKINLGFNYYLPF